MFRLLVLTLAVLAVADLNVPHRSTEELGELIAVQTITRHGAKLPDTIDPLLQDFFDMVPTFELPPLGMDHPDSGIITKRGALIGRSTGELLRELYITEEPLLGRRYDQRFGPHVRISSLNDRPPHTTPELTRGIYPQDPIPIWTADIQGGAFDKLLNPSTTCISFVLEFPRIIEEFNMFLMEKFPDLLFNITQHTGFADAGMELDPFQLLDVTEENIFEGLGAGLEDLDTFLLQQSFLIHQLKAHGYLLQLSAGDPTFHNPRGFIAAELANEVAMNFDNVVNDMTTFKMFNYMGHSIATVQPAWLSLGLGEFLAQAGEGIFLELRRISGQFFVNALQITPNHEGTEVNFTPIPLRCPRQQLSCLLSDFTTFIRAHNPPFEEGCCFRGPGFHDLGCDDFLNPDVLMIPECKTFRQLCPANACDDGQVLAAATLLCVEVKH